jgi:hypothetical protein
MVGLSFQQKQNKMNEMNELNAFLNVWACAQFFFKQKYHGLYSQKYLKTFYSHYFLWACLKTKEIGLFKVSLS